MSPFLAVFHFLGTKPLLISLIAQFVVFGVALKMKDKSSIRQSLIVGAGLLCVVISIQLRPPSPINYWADGISVVSTVLFTIPAIEAIGKLRAKKEER